MHNVIEDFLANPCAETFKPIKSNSYLLAKIFRLDEELAKEFFGFAEWFLIKKKTTNLDIKEKVVVQDGLKSAISCFADAIKYYHTLNYDERKNWQNEFISHAQTVKDCQYLLYTLNKSHRKEVVEKMHTLAITDEDKKIAFSYTI